MDQDGRSLLEPGDTLKYLSNLNNKAVFTVLKKITGSLWDDRPPGIGQEEGRNVSKDYYEYEVVLIDSVGKDLTEKQIKALARSDVQSIKLLSGERSMLTGYPDFISIFNDATGSTFTGTGQLRAIWYYSGIYSENYILSSSMKILNNEFKNVFYGDLSLPVDTTERYVITIFCNSHFGLLGFKYSDGEIFELN